MVYSDQLSHYGIEGQKWGIRRFQNDDGTLTEEGKRRYLSDLSKSDKRDRKDIENAPNELKTHRDNKKQLIEGAKKQFASDPKSKQDQQWAEKTANSWYNQRLKYLERLQSDSEKDLRFNEGLRKFLKSSKSIKISDLNKEITSLAKKNNMDAEWVSGWYKQLMEDS